MTRTLHDDGFIDDPEAKALRSAAVEHDQYARDNPLRFQDPTGRYVCADSKKCDSDQDKKFEAARQKDLKSSDRDVSAAAAAFGDPNKTNTNITLKFDANASEAGSVVQDKDANGHLLKSATVTLRTASDSLSGQITVAHEGSHVEDFNRVMSGATPVTLYQTEMKAFQTGAGVLSDAWPGVTNFSLNTNYGSFVFLAPVSAEDIQINKQSAKDLLRTPDYNLSFEHQGGFPYVLR